jgi:hypothetical protein
MKVGGKVAGLAIVAAALVWQACGDAPTTDPRRSYTKAPLERPGMVVQPEQATAMSELGTPILIPVLEPGTAPGTPTSLPVPPRPGAEPPTNP